MPHLPILYPGNPHWQATPTHKCLFPVEEDVYASYSRLLFKYFLSEGVMCGHTLFLAGANGRTEDILKVRPGQRVA